MFIFYSKLQLHSFSSRRSETADEWRCRAYGNYANNLMHTLFLLCNILNGYDGMDDWRGELTQYGMTGDRMWRFILICFLCFILIICCGCVMNVYLCLIWLRCVRWKLKCSRLRVNLLMKYNKRGFGLEECSPLPTPFRTCTVYCVCWMFAAEFIWSLLFCYTCSK